MARFILARWGVGLVAGFIIVTVGLGERGALLGSFQLGAHLHVPRSHAEEGLHEGTGGGNLRTRRERGVIGCSHYNGRTEEARGNGGGVEGLYGLSWWGGDGSSCLGAILRCIVVPGML